MMNKLINSGRVIAVSCEGNPVLAMLVVFGFYMFFNTALAHVETLIWGERFPHWFDVAIMFVFMAYMAMCVWFCARFQMGRGL